MSVAHVLYPSWLLGGSQRIMHVLLRPLLRTRQSLGRGDLALTLCVTSDHFSSKAQFLIVYDKEVEREPAA